jgi:hypothetical protein
MPAIFFLASVLRHASARMVIVSDPDCREARDFLTRLDVMMCVVEADRPLPIEKVAGFVAVLLEVIRSGCIVALLGEAVEEVALLAICTAVVLGVPSALVVDDLAQLGWIDPPSYVEFADDFRAYWLERSAA